jgi:pimeloyl-ACP methyl ester carboxylesterase
MTTTSISLPQPQRRDLQLLRSSFQLLDFISPKLSGRIAAKMFITPRRRSVSANARQIMSQAAATTVRHGSRNLAVHVWGEPGPPVFLQHGWEANASTMRGFVRPLLRQGYQVIAFDAPAHGDSEGKQTNLIEYGSAIQTVANTFGHPQAIIAHSAGAAATLLMLGRDPGFQVDHVVSLGAPSRLVDMLSIWTTFLGLSPATVGHMRQRLVDRVGFNLEAVSVETAVRNITVPGLVVHDLNDTVVSFANGEAIAQNWATAVLVQTAGLDHRGALQDRNTIRQVVSFINGADVAS